VSQAHRRAVVGAESLCLSQTVGPLQLFASSPCRLTGVVNSRTLYPALSVKLGLGHGFKRVWPTNRVAGWSCYALRVVSRGFGRLFDRFVLRLTSGRVGLRALKARAR
jgi:hypothetical protein